MGKAESQLHIIRRFFTKKSLKFSEKYAVSGKIPRLNIQARDFSAYSIFLGKFQRFFREKPPDNMQLTFRFAHAILILPLEGMYQIPSRGKAVARG